MRPSNDQEINNYLTALRHELNAERDRYCVSTVPVGSGLLAAVVEYKGKGQTSPGMASDLASAAAARYAREGASTLTQSRYLWHSREKMASVILKPRDRLHWTLDRGFADADLVMAAIMAGYSTDDAR